MATAPVQNGAQERTQQAVQWVEVDRRLTAIEAATRAAEANLAFVARALMNQPNPSSLATVLPALIAALAGLVGEGIGGIIKLQGAAEAAGPPEEPRGCEGREDRELFERQTRLQIGQSLLSGSCGSCLFCTALFEHSSVNRLGCIVR
jgi:hypothetical protein